MTPVTEVSAVRDLSKADIAELYALFGTAFQASQKGFEDDLEEKDYLLRVRHEGELQAFSTLKLYYPEPGARLIFSGDTFTSESARSGHHLPSRWARFVFTELPGEPGLEDWWLLLCSGYRTYRILPTFFESYVPSPDSHPSLVEKRDRWASQLFGDRYANGVVRPRWPTPLYLPEPPARLENDHHVQLFVHANPGYRQGEELACLVPLERTNLRPCGRRLVSAASP